MSPSDSSPWTLHTGGVYLQHITPSAEREILRMARVSSPNPENEDVSLIRFLIRNKHWSPFELAHAAVEIHTSRAIAQQILRHRSFSFQEFSQRYAQASGAIVYPARSPAAGNRQSSVDNLDEETKRWFKRLQQHNIEECFAAYHQAIEAGVAKECARFLLPLSTQTTLFMVGSIRSWIHYLELRTDPHTQEEHRVIALQIRDLLARELPTITTACGWDEVQAED